MTEDEMVGWHHQINGHEFDQTPGDSEGQGSLLCCSQGVAKSRTGLSDQTITAKLAGEGARKQTGLVTPGLFVLVSQYCHNKFTETWRLRQQFILS